MARLSQKQFFKLSAESGLSLGLQNPINAPLPPAISSIDFNEQGGFDLETIVSCSPDGGIASRFKDPGWDFEAHANVTSRKFVMNFSENEAYVNEVKTMLLLVLLTPVISPAKLDIYWSFYYLMMRLAKLCNSEGITIKTAFNMRGGIRLVKLFENEMQFCARNIIVISDYLNFMRDEAGFEHGYNSLSKTVRARIAKVALEYKANLKQTSVIPSRILKAIYHDTIAEYEVLLPVLDELLAMQDEIESHPMVGLCTFRQRDNCPKYCGTSYSQLKNSYPTNYDLARKYPLARNFLNSYFCRNTSKPSDSENCHDVLYNRNDALNGISYIQRVCQDIIIMFTGMRPVEASLLPYFGIKETLVDGVKYWLICGFAVKKRTSTPPFELWVTNEYGYRAYQTAKRIANLYYRRNDRQPIEIMPDGDLSPDLSPLYLRENGKIDQRFGTTKKTPALTNAYPITKDDFNELKMIDPHRKWESELKFAVGMPFPVELRQFRRSIAFFASASGVRLVDLKNQLHHLFDRQTFYYSSGSGRANPFLKDKDSFASYFNQVKHEAEAFSFINEVINFDGKLFGASATFAERNKSFYSTIRNEDRTETVKRFKRGELAYTETHLGGCQTLTPCKSKALGSVTACLSCNDSDIRPAKLAHAIKEQAEFVDRLNPDKLEFRTEIQELIVMLDFAVRNLDKAMKDLDPRKAEYKQFSHWAKEFKQMRKRYLKKVQIIKL